MKKGALFWWVRWTHRADTRDFGPTLAALVSQAQNIFSSLITFSLHLSPSPSQLGRQSCRVACLIICVSDFFLCSTNAVFMLMAQAEKKPTRCTV
jgi:hypothetical protein